MRYWLEYIPFIVIATIVRALPRSTALAFGGWLGRIGKSVQSRRVRISSENLRGAFPEMPADEVAAIIDKMFIHLGKSFIDMLRLDLYRTDADKETYFELEGQDHIDEALELGRGCIILTGHVGFWECGNFTMPKMGYDFGVVAKPMRNPLVDEYFKRMRTATGSYIINSRKGARVILKALKKNHCVGLLLDQHIGGKGSVTVPFFGRPAHTTAIITQMAIRYQVPVVPVFAYRREDDTYFTCADPMVLLEGDLSDENVKKNTELLNQLTEKGIRKELSQWFWLHRRWRPCCEDDA